MNELIEYKEMREAIVRVRELHKPTLKLFTEIIDRKPFQKCSWCEQRYPCPTIKALDGER